MKFNISSHCIVNYKIYLFKNLEGPCLVLSQ
jgi:hypothetical protein